VYAGKGVYPERMVEECRSGDIAECIRVFDRSPNKEWPLKVKNVVLAGRPFLRMPFVVDDIERETYKKDGESPATWYLCFGNVRDQRDVLLYEILPFMVEMKAEGGDILWCPSTDKVENADYRQDALEILDACEKLEEFNVSHETKFRLGLAKVWLPKGKEFERERVYCCRLGAALDVIGFHYVQCRVLNLGVFTTTDDVQKGGEVVDVQCHGDLLFREEAYLDTSGYKLKDYCYRTVRQRIRKLLGDEGVEPKDWNESRSAGLIRAPGDKRGTGFRIFDAPRGSPLKGMILERARIRVTFSEDKTARKDLPQLGPMKFGMFNYTSRNVKPQDLSRTAKTTLGNGVRESILPPDYVAFPDEAMTRFKQERGFLKDSKIVRVPRPVVVCQGEVRQAVTASVQKEEQKVLAEPTTLIGAVRALNRLNDGKATAAQQRLKNRGTAVLDRSDSSVEFVAEVKGNPEKERREKPVVRLTPPVVEKIVTPAVQAVDTPVDVLDEEGDSDDPDSDRIILQRLKVKLETERLAKYEAEYVLNVLNE
jgi:hypothetical protein